MTDDTRPYYGNPFIYRQGRDVRDREKVEPTPETAELIAGFHPVLGPALSVKDFEKARQEGDMLGMGLAGIGAVPVLGGATKVAAKAGKMGYEVFKDLPDIVGTFRTARGSTYAHHADATTTRNRSGVAHKDTTEGMQPRSGKTIFVDPDSVNRVAGLFQNPDMATRIVPKLDKSGKPTGTAMLQLVEDYGPRKAGEVIHEFPYTTKPQVGFNPVEIYRSESPIGNAGSGIHFGNSITEVIPVSAKKSGGAIKMPDNYSSGNWKLI